MNRVWYCTLTDMNKVHEFASKWIGRFCDEHLDYREIVGNAFMDDCIDLQFIMDCGHRFGDAYGKAVYNAGTLENVINKIDDVPLLGSAVFSQWRYFNHWAYSGSEVTEPENRRWFILVLQRLLALSEEKENTLRVGENVYRAVYFHSPDEENGYLSNWYLSPFEVDGIRFSSSEQYIMYRKCKLFGDDTSAGAVMATDDVAKQQAIGRKAKGYIESVWSGMRQVVCYEGLLAKFGQNTDLRKRLLNTGDAFLVECAATDKVWACGIRVHDDLRLDMKNWNGKSLLGYTLMEVRRKLASSPDPEEKQV